MTNTTQTDTPHHHILFAQQSSGMSCSAFWHQCCRGVCNNDYPEYEAARRCLSTEQHSITCQQTRTSPYTTLDVTKPHTWNSTEYHGNAPHIFLPESETWILHSLNHHFPLIYTHFYWSCQTLYMNNVKFS